jgi:cytochrome oxidase Cu insertion factor (SCO1/SenC/PrrC family)
MENNNRLVRPTIIFGILMLLAAFVLGGYALWATRGVGGGSGVALVGGPFTMVNHRGETVTEKTFLGKPMLLFFGFTYCPDVCPTELQVMAAAISELGDDGKDIQPILVSVDPARDTPDVLSNYVANFGEQFVGLTGTDEQVKQITSAYRVFYEKRENKADPKNYLMDHSSIIYLMGPDGQFLKHFSYTTDAKILAEGLRKALKRG